MSLATALLNGTAGVGGTVDTSMYDYSRVATCESTYFSSACVDLFTDVLECDRIYATMDTIATAKVITEGADPEALFENMITSGIEKLKEVFRKFIAKIKEFYNKAIRYIKSYTLTGEKFVKEFKKDLETKEREKEGTFTYKGYDYNPEGGDSKADALFNQVINKFDGVFTGLDYASLKDKSDEDIVNAVKELAQNSTEGQSTEDGKIKWMSSADYKEKVISDLNFEGATNETELANELTKVYRGDTEEKEDVEDFGRSDVTSMCNYITNSNKKIQQLKKDQKKFEDTVNKVITKLDKIEKLMPEEKGKTPVHKDHYGQASALSKYATVLLNLGRIPCNTKISMAQEITKNYEATLKAFLRKKIVAEAMEAEDVPEEDPMDGETEEGCGSKATSEGCGSRKSTSEGCGSKGGCKTAIESYDLLAEATQYL